MTVGRFRMPIIHINPLTPIQFGVSYNFYAASDSRFCPPGYRLPTYTELQNLAAIASSNANNLKVSGTEFWLTNNGNNSLLFNAKGSGYRDSVTGAYQGYKSFGFIWSSTGAVTVRNMSISDIGSLTIGLGSKAQGKQVRLIKTDPLSWSVGDTVTDYDGNIYPTVQVGSQVWITENYICRHFSDNSIIPYEGVNVGYFTDAEWIALTGAGCCPPNGDWSKV